MQPRIAVFAVVKSRSRPGAGEEDGAIERMRHCKNVPV
jgi:hypothetical protein